MKNLLRLRKLYLVLDLDHTLLNSTPLMTLTTEEEYLKNQIDSLQRMYNCILSLIMFFHGLGMFDVIFQFFLDEINHCFYVQ